MAVELVGKGDIRLTTRDLDFPSRGSLNINAARRDFKFTPKIDVKDGFHIYYEWLKNSTYFNK
jgi:nucleoside-diphosphate-sugar epimerase